MTVYDYDGPDNHNEGVLRASVVVPGRIIVYGFTVYSTNAAAQFLCVFDASLLPGNGATPAWTWPLAAHNGAAFDWTPKGRRFDRGIVLTNSSTDATNTIGSADCLFDVQFDVCSTCGEE